MVSSVLDFFLKTVDFLFENHALLSLIFSGLVGFEKLLLDLCEFIVDLVKVILGFLSLDRL